MRKLEKAMCAAINSGQAWSGANTTVSRSGEVYLHGNRIAFRNNSGALETDLETFKKWPTVTTKSRLRALGLNFPYIKQHRRS